MHDAHFLCHDYTLRLKLHTHEQLLSFEVHNDVNELRLYLSHCVFSVFWVSHCMKLLAYLRPRGVACASPSGGSLHRTVWAFGWESSAAVRVAEALTVLFADLREQTVKCLHIKRWLYIRLSRDLEASGVCSLYQLVQLNSAQRCKGSAFITSTQKLFTLKETHCGHYGRQYTYFLLEKAVEDEDKHSLKRVEYGEEVCHDNRGLVDEEEAERPRQAQKTEQSEGTHDPGSEGRQAQGEDVYSMRGIQYCDVTNSMTNW